jgi:ACS family hexuronate transporter-like MFS transporter
MISGDPVVSPASSELQTKVGNFRWFICGLLFYATTVNYMDRVVMGILKTTIAQDLHWTDSDYGQITAAFQIGYALMLPVAGRLIDWLGLRIGYSLAVLVWGLSSIGHSFAGNLVQFSVARLGLGLGEAANFPAAIKAVADWFPRKERALATGIFNSGTNVGALIAPLIVPIVVARYGWHSAFVVTGSISLSWILVWLYFYREPEKQPRLSAPELAYIRSDGHEDSTVKIPYLTLLSKRATWAFLLAKFFTDPVWWFYLFWIPGFFATKYHVDLQHIGPPLVVIYLAADVGSVAGGWLSSWFLKRGWELTRARKTTMLIFACLVLAIVFVPFAAGNLWLTVALIGIAAGSHQGWSANVFTMGSDCFPRKAVGSVVGIGGLGGAIGGALVQPAVGKWLDLSHQSYAPLFFIAGGMYLFTLLIINLILPRFKQESFAS